MEDTADRETQTKKTTDASNNFYVSFSKLIGLHSKGQETMSKVRYDHILIILF